MGKRIFLGGLVGAVLVFLVGSIWHLVAGLGDVGIKSLPNEDVVLTAMRASIHDSGFYFFPAPDTSRGRSKEQMQADQSAYLATFKRGPTGILIYSPGGEELAFGKLLLNQFLFGLVAAFFLAWILGLTASATTYATRVWIVILVSLFAAVVYDVPYWNWYGFPMNYTLGHIAGWTVSWGVAGLGMAGIVKRPAAG